MSDSSQIPDGSVRTSDPAVPQLTAADPGPASPLVCCQIGSQYFLISQAECAAQGGVAVDPSFCQVPPSPAPQGQIAQQ